MQSIMDTEKTRCLIIGSGPAGYTAAIYASRANLNPILYEGTEPGGQLTSTTDIENFPGYPEGISGTAMMEDLKKQAQRFGADVRFGIITSVDLSVRPFKVVADGRREIETDALIISTGATAKYLGLASEQRYKGMGVSACATCDGFFYRKKDVIVVGGGDTACEEATYLATLCNSVYGGTQRLPACFEGDAGTRDEDSQYRSVVRLYDRRGTRRRERGDRRVGAPHRR